MEAKIQQLNNSEDLVIPSHNLVIWKRFKITIFIVKNI